MPNVSDLIHVLTREEIVWPFRGADAPYVTVGRSRYGRQEPLDPFPCYPIDAEIVARALEHVLSCFPLAEPPHYYLLPCERLSRTNGSEFADRDYDSSGKGGPLLTSIVLSAKRIPIHPATIRYLVTHEYGHAVEDLLNAGEGFQEHDEGVLRHYGELRGVPYGGPHYGGGTWHAAIGEIFACDFRLIVCGVESEFWPHPGIERPETLPAVVEYWQAKVAEVRAQKGDK